MSKRVKVISTLSRKVKLNILVIMVLLFIGVTVFLSLSQVSKLMEEREKVLELQEKLSWTRNENIKLLAQEKSLYSEQGVEREARSQFNMTKLDEQNYFVVVEQDAAASINQMVVYSNSDLWENIKIFYHNEVKEN
ncbi:MAG: cell division protein FtsL [Actinomycetota bacterium]|jgi:cell division protein FtsB|nr:cell division protein FtsL [Actinomycetota bacterium]